MERKEIVVPLSEADLKLSSEQTYDSSLAALVKRLDRFVVPLINELFGEHFPDDTRVVIRSGKHILPQWDGALQRRDSDAFVELYDAHGKMLGRYHFECEVRYRNTVIIRVAEYGSAISIENAQLTKDGLVLTYPDSGLVFLRPNGNIPKDFRITIKVPQGGEVSYTVPAIQIRDYGISELFEKKLLILLPFYLFRHANELAKLNQNEDQRAMLNDELNNINLRLEDMCDKGELSSYETLLIQEFLKRISDKLTIKHKNVRKDVDEIMSGYIARTRADEILEQGIDQGTDLLAGTQNWLHNQNRDADILRVIQDVDYRKQMIGEYRASLKMAESSAISESDIIAD